MASNHRRTFTFSMLTSMAVAGVWVFLAWRTPTSTYHFAPLIAAGAGPWVTKARAGRQLWPEALVTVTASLTAVAGAIVILAVGDRLEGPTFWSESGAVGEAILFALVGALIGGAALLTARATSSVAAAD